ANGTDTCGGPRYISRQRCSAASRHGPRGVYAAPRLLIIGTPSSSLLAGKIAKLTPFSFSPRLSCVQKSIWGSLTAQRGLHPYAWTTIQVPSAIPSLPLERFIDRASCLVDWPEHNGRERLLSPYACARNPDGDKWLANRRRARPLGPARSA